MIMTSMVRNSPTLEVSLAWSARPTIININKRDEDDLKHREMATGTITKTVTRGFVRTAYAPWRTSYFIRPAVICDLFMKLNYDPQPDI